MTKSTFLYQVKKYLYQIRSHPVTREKYDACFAYVHRFYTQRQPADMPYEEWQRVQLTEAKVLTYLKQALCRQNAKPERCLSRKAGIVRCCLNKNAILTFSKDRSGFSNYFAVSTV